MEFNRVGSLAEAKVERRMNVALATFCMGLRVPHGANGPFKAMISCDSNPGFGRRQQSVHFNV